MEFEYDKSEFYSTLTIALLAPMQICFHHLLMMIWCVDLRWPTALLDGRTVRRQTFHIYDSNQ